MKECAETYDCKCNDCCGINDLMESLYSKDEQIRSLQQTVEDLKKKLEIQIDVKYRFMDYVADLNEALDDQIKQLNELKKQE